jgi:uncharacterized protein (TIGR01244 family)
VDVSVREGIDRERTVVPECAMRTYISVAAGVLAIVGLCATSGAAQQVSKPSVPGIKNLARLETTIACAGAITPESVPAIKQMGFVSIINLRLASEADANIEGEAAAAKGAGLRYFHVPFNGSTPDPEAARQFLDAITSEGAEPAFVHCAGGNRAATMWLIKRIAVDHWDVDRATTEAVALGQTSTALREFAIAYAQSHQR